MVVDEPQPERGRGAGARSNDGLLLALSHLCSHFGRPRAPDAIRSSLPDSGGGLSPKLFKRAAASAGLLAEVQQCPVEKIKKLPLPAVLILNDGGAVVLHRLASGGQAEIYLPDSQQTRRASIEALRKLYAGYAIPVRPDPRAPNPTDEKSDLGALLDLKRNRGHWFWSALMENKRVYTQVALAAVLVNIFALAGPIFVMTVYNRVVPNEATETLAALVIGVLIVFAFDFLIRSVRAYMIDVAGHNADQVLATRVFDKLLDLQMAVKPPATGGFAAILKEFESLRDFFTSASLVTIVDMPFVVLFIAFMFVIGGPLAWVVVAATVLTFIIGLAVHVPLGSVMRQLNMDGANKHAVLVESVSGLETIKALGAEGRARHKWEHAVELTAESATKARTLSSLAVNLTQLIQQLTTVVIVALGVFLVKDGSISSGALIAVVILSGRALGPIGAFGHLLVRAHGAVATLKALDKVMELPVERPAAKSFFHRPTLRGEIAFRDVSFAYPRSEVQALSHASFSIQAGETVGVVGRIGSGKSTLHKLILGLYQPTSGSVMVDGTDIRQIDPADLRRNIGYLPQDVVLFRGTLRENIAMAAPNATDDAVLRAATIAGADDWIRRAPAGYDMVIGERGEGLSGGQRQAIGLARALVTDPQILLLDEPTASLDSQAEDQFRKRLSEASVGKTLVLVTHRNALLPLVTRLMVVDGGRIVADGPRDGVLQALAGGQVRKVEPAATR